MAFENRRWLILPTSLTGSINFEEVHETGIETLRLSVDETQTFVKYEVNEVTESYEEYYPSADNPDTFSTSSIEAGVYGRPEIYSEDYQELTHSEILELLSTSTWSLPIEQE